MFEKFRTNLPKEAMLFQDEPFRDELPSFMSHEHVLEYLNEFSKDFPIQFSSTVNEVKRENDLWKVNNKTTIKFFIEL